MEGARLSSFLLILKTNYGAVGYRKGFKAARDEKEAQDFWQNRKYALWSTMSLYPGSRVWTTDVAYVAIFLALSRA